MPPCARHGTHAAAPLHPSAPSPPIRPPAGYSEPVADKAESVNSTAPEPRVAGFRLASLCLGNMHVCGVEADTGRIVCWG